MRLASALAIVAMTAGPALAASAEHGKLAFMQHGCWECHGTMGQGSIATSGGKRIAPDPLPWEAFSAFVRSSNRSMPAFSEKILSDADLADIYAYLQSIPKPPDVNSIELLKQ
ncbi:MAG TPA: cytochrome c [Pseudolabrys sp.]|jgi:mono/diheme cytochrome c family protein|nr:cytochrome c [Pseudolabrys sp.]